MSQKIAVIGAGISGLSLSYQLLKKGAEVSLFDEPQSNQKCSNKAAGMLCPFSELRYSETDILDLGIFSLSLYEIFIKEIEKISGLKTDFYRKGSLSVAIDSDDLKELQRLHDFQKKLGLKLEWLSREACLKKFEYLNPKIEAGIFSPDERCLDNQLLLKALKQANEKLKIKTIPAKVTELLFENQRCLGLIAQSKNQKNKKLYFDKIILATGLNLDLSPYEGIAQLRPVKGQALSVQSQGSIKLPFPIRSLHRFPAYLVPRSDGRIIIGASSEEQGPGTENTGNQAGIIMDLIHAAWKIMPAIYEFPIIETWHGFRPASLDHSPKLGKTQYENLYTSLGLYRHGFLMAPAVSQLLAELIIDEKENSRLELFSNFH